MQKYTLPTEVVDSLIAYIQSNLVWKQADRILRTLREHGRVEEIADGGTTAEVVDNQAEAAAITEAIGPQPKPKGKTKKEIAAEKAAAKPVTGDDILGKNPLASASRRVRNRK